MHIRPSLHPYILTGGLIVVGWRQHVNGKSLEKDPSP
jgi:hypothetical protein